jgi:hypothetical protein
VRVVFLIVLAASLAAPAASAPRATHGLPERQVGFDESPMDWSPGGRIVCSHVFEPSSPESSVFVVRDGEVDTVRCGPGTADTVVADTFDVVAPDCERVRRR